MEILDRTRKRDTREPVGKEVPGMSGAYTLKISEEQIKEMPMVDIAFLILKSANTTFYFRDLMKEIAKVKGLSEDGMLEVIAQLYTEINIDGRFACVGSNVWGLKRWYPVDRSDDVGGGKYPRIINDDDDDEEEDYFAEEEEETYAGGDEEDYDSFDEDAEAVEGEEDEEDAEFFEEGEAEEIDEEDAGEGKLDEGADEEDAGDEGDEDEDDEDEDDR